MPTLKSKAMFNLEGQNKISISISNFRDEVLRSKEVVMVEFTTKWSGACHMMEPVVKEVIAQYQGKIKFCEVNFEDNKEITTRYNVTKVPVILFFKDSKIIDKVDGVVSKKVMLNKVKILLRNHSLQNAW